MIALRIQNSVLAVKKFLIELLSMLDVVNALECITLINVLECITLLTLKPIRAD